MFPFFIFLSASTPLVTIAPCPKIKPVTNFNLTAFASGTWHDVARYPDKFERNGVCMNMSFQTQNGIINFNLTEVTDNKLETFKGYVEFAKNAGNTGIVNMHSSEFADAGGEVDLILNFLSIDYDSYYIMYNCKYDEKNKSRFEYAWIGSREKVLDPAAKAKVDDFLKSADQNEHPIDVKKLFWLSYTENSCKFT